eukprot:Hpha_TRINITY_DN14111_c0_g1::TRINITY_DN14111_c0_g1_i1::g.10457::m.10457/K03094/SKP1, CBF3D; S-phase kinase-associated protein 1
MPHVPLSTPGDHSEVDFSRFVVVQAQDQVEFAVLKEAAKMSAVMASLVDTQNVIQVQVPSRPLSSVIEFCEHHWDCPLPTLPRPLQDPLSTYLPSWDNQFLGLGSNRSSNPMLTDESISILNAANALGVTDCVDLFGALIADKIKGKSPAEIKEVLRTQ